MAFMYHVRKERLYFYCTVLSNSLQQGTFSPRPSYSVIAIGIRQAGKSMRFAKLSETILKKLEPTVGKLFLRVSMFEYTFQIYHFELTFVKCRKKFIYSDVDEHMITILLSESEKRFSQFVW